VAVVVPRTIVTPSVIVLVSIWSLYLVFLFNLVLFFEKKFTTRTVLNRLILATKNMLETNFLIKD